MKAKIGIDPGHGGSSSGTYSASTVRDGLFEKDYALGFSMMLKAALERNGFSVIMTREGDFNPGSVSERAKIVADAGADFALSVHFNGFGDESANGAEVFVPYPEKIAAIESGLYSVLKKFFRIRNPFARSSSYFDKNRIFDKKLDAEAGIFGASENEKDYFGFIRGCRERGISADLLEICFLTNKKDLEQYLEHRDEIAEGIAKSIVEGFGEKFIGKEEKTVPLEKPATKFDVIN